MKYTIVDAKNGNAKMIQQDFAKIEDAEAKLKIVKAKASDKYTPVLVGVDADGNFHSLDKAAEKPKAPVK